MSSLKTKRPQALVVEDDYFIALNLEADVQALGFEVFGIAPTAKDAIALAMEQKPDLVLMDIYLNGARDGIEAGRWIHDVCDAPVVFVTAHTDEGTIERIREQVPGAPVLSKPVYGDHLATAIAEARQSVN